MTLWGIIRGLLVQEETDRTKQLSVEVDSGATTNTRTTLKSAQTADRTVNIPDASDTLVGKATTDVLTNKTIDADNNTISELETDNLKAGVLNTNLAGAATDAELPSALAVKTALEAQNEADEITYDNTTSGLTATDVQAAVDEVEGRLDTAETGLSNHLADAVDAHDASAISNVPSGNLAATDIQSAVDELQGDIDTNASGLSNHLADAVDAHDASAISNVPAGNLAATEVQAALNELQTDVDSRALDSDLTNHISDAVGAHAASAISFSNGASGMTATEVQAAIDENDGRLDTLEAAGSGANTALSNLTATSINQDLIFSVATPTIGSAAAESIEMKSGDAGSTTNTGAVIVNSGAQVGTGDSGGVTVKSGNASGGDSGDITLTPGTATGTRGSILIQDGTEGTSGHVLTSTGVNGAVSWAAPAAGGATAELDNLGTTAINADLNFPFGGGSTINLDNNVYITGRNSTDVADRNMFKIGDATYGNNIVAGLSVLPQTNESQDFGSPTFTYSNGYFGGLIVRDSSTQLASIEAVAAGATSPSGRTYHGVIRPGADLKNLGILGFQNSRADLLMETGDFTINTSSNTGELSFTTGNHANAGGGNGDTGNITIATGNNALGGTLADSGNIAISTGTVNGGTRGVISMDTDKLDVSAVSEGVGLPVWKKVTVGHAALQTASTTNDIELLSLPAMGTVHAVIIKHSTAFAGTGITAYTASVGIAGDLTKYASAFDVLQATGDTVAQTTNVIDVEDFGSAASIRLSAVSTGANLDQSSAGSVDVYVLMSTLPA